MGKWYYPFLEPFMTTTAITALATAVYAITNRPDLSALTTLAIKRATIKEHAAMDYPRDLVLTAPIALDNSNGLNRYSLDEVTLGLYGMIRKIKFIKELNNTQYSSAYYSQGYWGELDFKERAPNNLFDEYNMEYTSYYFRQGTSINIVAVRAVNYIGIQYYQQPNIVDLTYASWIADMYPYVIYEAAAANVFQAIGKNDEAGVYRGKLMDNRLDLIKAEIGDI